MLVEGTTNKETDSNPTTVAGESKLITVTSDTTDEGGIRHVVIQTTAPGNDREGYKAAERQAHEWFFRNYDKNFGTSESFLADLRFSDDKKASFAKGIMQDAIESGYLNPDWLECPHPVIEQGKGRFMFGHHCGVNPTAAEPTWGFQFEILPMGGVDLN
jgi:hypothetical protein